MVKLKIEKEYMKIMVEFIIVYNQLSEKEKENTKMVSIITTN